MLTALYINRKAGGPQKKVCPINTGFPEDDRYDADEHGLKKMCFYFTFMLTLGT